MIILKQSSSIVPCPGLPRKTIFAMLRAEVVEDNDTTRGCRCPIFKHILCRTFVRVRHSCFSSDSAVCGEAPDSGGLCTYRRHMIRTLERQLPGTGVSLGHVEL